MDEKRLDAADLAWFRSLQREFDRVGYLRDHFLKHLAERYRLTGPITISDDGMIVEQAPPASLAQAVEKKRRSA